MGGRSGVWGASDSVTQKFTGQERDAETALDFFQARYFSGGLGRFMSPDPGNAGADLTNPQSLNGYGYVLGNPLGLVDPSGLDDQPIPVACPDCTVTVDGGSSSPTGTQGFPYEGPFYTGTVFSATGYYAPPRHPTPVSTPQSLPLIRQPTEAPLRGRFQAWCGTFPQRRLIRSIAKPWHRKSRILNRLSSTRRTTWRPTHGSFQWRHRGRQGSVNGGMSRVTFTIRLSSQSERLIGGTIVAVVLRPRFLLRQSGTRLPVSSCPVGFCSWVPLRYLVQRPRPWLF